MLGASVKGDEGLFADLYTSFGLGHLWSGGEKEIYGLVGGGMLLHTPVSWLSVRFDLKGIFLMLDNTEGGDFNADTTLSMQ